MLKLFNRFLIFALLLASVLYTISLNREAAVLRLTPTYEFQASSGYLFIAIFFAGILVSGLVSLLFALRAFMKESRFVRRERYHQEFFKLFSDARGFMITEEWGKAQSLWQKILSRDPENASARVELSRCIENLGDLNQALQNLDSARSQKIHNTELLFRAAQLNTKLENYTAAIDNLTILLSESPSAKAAELACELSQKIGRLDDALHYHDLSESLRARPNPLSTEQKASIQLKLLLRDAPDQSACIEALLGFVKRHQSNLEAIDALASKLASSGDRDRASLFLTKAAKISGEECRWESLVDFSLESISGSWKNAERAIANLKSASAEVRGVARMHAVLGLARLFVGVNKLDDALKTLADAEKIANAEGIRINGPLQTKLLSLRGRCLAQQGSIREASDLWSHLSENQAQTTAKALAVKEIPEQPAASLSTL